MVLAALLSIPVASFAAALAFYRVNGKPFIEMLEAGFNYYRSAKLFLWKHSEPKAANQAPAAPTATEMRAARGAPKLTRGRLAEIAWSLDIKSQNASMGLRAHQ